jgi:hypothetical protein
VAFLFLHSSWEQFPVIAWPAPSFDFPQNMSETDNGQTIAVAASTQVKLCPYDEEEPAIWFRLIEAQFAAAGTKSQMLRYAHALASLPKQVLRDILETVRVCNESDQCFDLLKDVLLGQFIKSKWQSCF